MNKRILITGANKGIGLATVRAVLDGRDDTKVWLGSRDLGRGMAARDALIDENSGWEARVEVLELDVSNDASVSRAADHVARTLDGATLYGIVNNAGIYSGSMQQVLEVNTLGPKRVCTRFLPLLREGGRVVNVSSAAGPNFVAACSAPRQRTLTSPEVTWEEVEGIMAESLELTRTRGDFAAAGLGEGASYGLSKACLNAYTIILGRETPGLTINACTPGFIETDLTRPFAEAKGVTPAEMGMKAVDQGTRATMHLLFGEVGASGWYFGSDALRSPLDRYRSPADPQPSTSLEHLGRSMAIVMVRHR